MGVLRTAQNHPVEYNQTSSAGNSQTAGK